ncbi:MAG: single-stranded DNA-binding protein [Phycisphaerales bacterium]|nr:single-stranded DNA-binding protein [Phycisphaerales bacterium]
MVSELQAVSGKLCDAVSDCHFDAPVTHVHNPLAYARSLHEQYLALAQPNPRALLLGMNPGPWGMAQTGVPFGEVAHVRDFLGIDGEVQQPVGMHPQRPIEGLQCARSEVSGRRLWAWGQSRFGRSRVFFKTFFVWNWCPLAFMEESGRNRTPDKLPAAERSSLEPACDRALCEVVDLLQPDMVIGVGAFAQGRAQRALSGSDIRIGRILHPSPASPAANRGWAEQIEPQLEALGIVLPATA